MADYVFDERELMIDAVCGRPVPTGGVALQEPSILLTQLRDVDDPESWSWDRVILKMLSNEQIYKLYVALKVHTLEYGISSSPRLTFDGATLSDREH